MRNKANSVMRRDHEAYWEQLCAYMAKTKINCDRLEEEINWEDWVYW